MPSAASSTRKCAAPVVSAARYRCLSEGFIDWPAFSESVAERGDFNSGDLRPFGNRLRLAAISDSSVASTVALLRQPISPPAVLWRIRTVVVDAINRVMFGWAWSHIAQKCHEAIAPFIAHNNTASAIASVRVVIRVVAAPLCATPDYVLRSLRQAMRGVASGFHSAAPTRSLFSRWEIARQYRLGRSAIASTQPFQAPMAVSASERRDYETTKSLTSKVVGVLVHMAIIYSNWRYLQGHKPCELF